jgi:uncharacterized membrane protein YgdD (TMEM256/DUF423 family)
MAASAFKTWLFLGSLLGAAAVAAGAFGAHYLKNVLKADAQQLANWETAARYQMYAALALLVIGLLAGRQPSALLNGAGGSMTLGTLIFSGCLYLLVLTGQRWLGAVVPIGGTLLIIGWLCLAAAAWRASPAPGNATVVPPVESR